MQSPPYFPLGGVWLWGRSWAPGGLCMFSHCFFSCVLAYCFFTFFGFFVFFGHPFWCQFASLCTRFPRHGFSLIFPCISRCFLASFFMFFRNLSRPRIRCAKPFNLMTLTVFWRVLAFRENMYFQLFPLLFSTSISTSISRAPWSRFGLPFGTVWVYFWWVFFTPFSVGRFLRFLGILGRSLVPKWAPECAGHFSGLGFVRAIGSDVALVWAKGAPKVPKVTKWCQKGVQGLPKGTQKVTEKVPKGWAMRRFLHGEELLSRLLFFCCAAIPFQFAVLFSISTCCAVFPF